MTKRNQILVLLMAAMLPTVACAQQPESHRPELARRIVTVFEFEQYNPSLPIPEDFLRAQHAAANQELHPGFPPDWNLAVFDTTVSNSGDSSIRLSVAGGNSGLSLKPGVLPIFIGADYVVSVQLRTDGLRHARAFLVARFLDGDMQPIDGTQRRSEPTLSDDRWSPLSVTMRNPPDEADYLQIDLEVLQPRYFQTPLLPEEHHIWHEDRDGSAWFDDLMVVQLPRVVISSNAKTNVVVSPEQPALNLRVTDLTGEPLHATLTILDARGRLVSRESIDIEAGRLTRQLTPNLPGFGWYDVTLDVVGENGFTGSTHLQLAWLAPNGSVDFDATGDEFVTKRTIVGERSRFAIIVSDLTDEQRALIPDLTSATGVGRVTLPLWDEQLKLAEISETLKSLSVAIDRMLTQGVLISLSLARTPGELAVKAGLPVRLPVLAMDPKSDRYKPFLEPFLERFGQVVQTWQIGRLGDEVDEPQSLENPDAVFSLQVPEPWFELPWLGEFQFDDGIRSERKLSGLRVLIPSSTNPSNIPEHISLVLSQFDQLSATDSITFVLEPISAERFGHQAVAEDLTKRVIEAWGVIGNHRVGPSLAIAQPWTTDPTAPDSVMPRPELVVWRNLIDRLAGRRVVDEVPLGPGVRVLILAPADQAPPSRGGALVAWRTGPEGVGQPLNLNLGRGIISTVDVFGNRSRINRNGQLADAGDAPRVRVGDPLAITSKPVFYEGVDVELLRFLAGLSLTPDLLTTKYLQHDCVLTVTNPWPQRISGQIAIIGPGGFKGNKRDRSWQISPRLIDFNLAAGAKAEFAVGVEFEMSQEATEIPLELEMEVLAQGQLRVTHKVPFRVGLPNLEQTLSYHFVRKGESESVVLEARYKNTGDEDVTVEISAFALGAGRRTASIGSLAPGRQAVRQFVFRDVDKVMGKSVSFRASTGTDGGQLINSIKVK